MQAPKSWSKYTTGTIWKAELCEMDFRSWAWTFLSTFLYKTVLQLWIEMPHTSLFLIRITEVVCHRLLLRSYLCVKLRWIGVPTRGSCFRRLSKLWYISRVEAWYSIPLFVPTRLPILSLIQSWLITLILTCVWLWMCQLKYYSSRVANLYLAYNSTLNKGQFSS